MSTTFHFLLRPVRVAGCLQPLRTPSRLMALLIGTAFCLAGAPPSPRQASPLRLVPATLPRLGTVDKHFQSYNVEMVELTGGNFWKPYASAASASTAASRPAEAPNRKNSPNGIPSSMFEYRPPLDLTNARLRRLAAALGPAYVRCSGTWANSIYFADSDEAPKSPPEGFRGVLTRPQWKGLLDFAKAVQGEIVTSFATSVGTRDAQGVWTPAQARQLLSYTESAGGRIVAAEFMNEPTFAEVGGAPKDYDATAYGRDFEVFKAFVKQAAPKLVVLGPGGTGETTGSWGMASSTTRRTLPTPQVLAATGPGVDAFSYHHYSTASQRCGRTLTADTALSEGWLARTDQTLAFYRQLRDQYEPEKPLWLTETADAACGGNPTDATFLDTFRYLDQLGRLAKQGVQVVMHNTLASSDYGLLDEQTLAPRPNYWGALLWHKLMGTTVLDAGNSRSGLHLYAHNLPGHRGGVTLLVINNSRDQTTSLELPVATTRYTLSAPKLESGQVLLNGRELKLGAGDALPALAGEPSRAGRVSFAPTSITFLTIANAGNKNSQ